jgi:hypothetical protein
MSEEVTENPVFSGTSLCGQAFHDSGWTCAHFPSFELLLIKLIDRIAKLRAKEAGDRRTQLHCVYAKPIWNAL